MGEVLNISTGRFLKFWLDELGTCMVYIFTTYRVSFGPMIQNQNLLGCELCRSKSIGITKSVYVCTCLCCLNKTKDFLTVSLESTVKSSIIVVKSSKSNDDKILWLGWDSNNPWSWTTVALDKTTPGYGSLGQRVPCDKRVNKDILRKMISIKRPSIGN